MKANLLWIDLEMTGLDPAKDKIVEVGAIATDFEFREIARLSATIRIDSTTMKRWMNDEFWNSRASERAKMIKQIDENGKSAREVENELLEFLENNFTKMKDLSESEMKKLAKRNPKLTSEDFAPIYLAGNSIHQDQKFIEREFPLLNSKLHYRQLDVSAWKIIFENRGVKFLKPENHRAMSDIEGSIDELKHYMKKVKF